MEPLTPLEAWGAGKRWLLHSRGLQWQKTGPLSRAPGDKRERNCQHSRSPTSTLLSPTIAIGTSSRRRIAPQTPRSARMATDGNTAQFLAANGEYAAGFSAADGAKAMPPAKAVAVVCCMDARIHPEAALGLSIGDAHMIRNAGGRVSEDALRSLVISEQLLGTKEILVLHHTDCGMLTFSNSDIHGIVKDRLGVDDSARDYLPFPDLEQSVRDDVAIVRNSPLIPKDIPVTGGVYDVKTGKITVVE